MDRIAEREKKDSMNRCDNLLNPTTSKGESRKKFLLMT
jgi:hypothetical protein